MAFLRGDIIDEYQGKLKTMREADIKRLIVQLLIMRVLKERFEAQTIRGTSVKNIMVFITLNPSRPALLKALETGKLPVLLSDGVKPLPDKCTIEITPEERREAEVGDSNIPLGAAPGSTVVTAQGGRTYVKQKTTNASNSLQQMEATFSYDNNKR